MGFRPTLLYFTCTSHIFVLYTFCLLYFTLLYLWALATALTFWCALCSLVFLGVFHCLHCHRQPLPSVAAINSIMILSPLVPLDSSSSDLHLGRRIDVIRVSTRPQAPLEVFGLSSMHQVLLTDVICDIILANVISISALVVIIATCNRLVYLYITHTCMIDTVTFMDCPEVTKYACTISTQEQRKEIIQDLYKLLYDIVFSIVFPFIVCTLFSWNYSKPSVKRKKKQNKTRIYPKGLYSTTIICF